MKLIIVSIVLAVLLVGGAIFYSKAGNSSEIVNNVSEVDGKQIIEITAKGRYDPKITQAKANMATLLRMKTNGTFDCTSALTIPKIGYQETLPSSGTIEIEIPAQKPGTVIQGICKMGMYSFTMNFN